MTTSTRLDPNGLAPEDIADAITGSAQHCASEHVEQGWDFDGEPYNVGSFFGDVEDLAKLLGRKPTDEEVTALEVAIREELATLAAKKADRDLASVEAAHDGDREARHPSE